MELSYNYPLKIKRASKKQLNRIDLSNDSIWFHRIESAYLNFELPLSDSQGYVSGS